MPVRLNLGCGPRAAPGWINSDILRLPGVDVSCDLREGLPLRSSTIDYAVAMHVLQDLAWSDTRPALLELNRVLKTGGVLRLGLPDLERAMRAYLDRDAQYFYVPDEDAKSVGAKLITQITWYGSVRTPFVFEFIEELLMHAGFERITRCPYKQTASVYPDIVQLDNRVRETLFVEASKV
jgi:predicted SAM-dependent methyltransferase